MSPPSDDDQAPEPGPAGGRPAIPITRAVVLLAVFVVLVVLVLGVIHPTSASTAVVGATTTTTAPSTTPTTTGHHAAPTTTTTSPASVTVVVANGSGVSGAAAAVTAKLKPQGWNLLTPTNATSEVTSTRVYYTSGFQGAATAIAGQLHVPSTAVAPYTTAAPLGSIGSADVAVVVGPDVADAVTSASTTTTTVAATTTTTPRSTTTTASR